jgi:hypothetical protein
MHRACNNQLHSKPLHAASGEKSEKNAAGILAGAATLVTDFAAHLRGSSKV